MKKILLRLLLTLTLCLFAWPVNAGSYPPAAGQSGSTAIHMDSVDFVAWAKGWINYNVGTDDNPKYRDPDQAIGKAEGSSFDIVSLGRGGDITLTFDPPIKNGSKWDFAVFENGFDYNFLELGYVEVSSNGTIFIRFENDSRTLNPVSAYGTLDPTDLTGFASKYKQGYGTPFDLQDLANHSKVLDGTINLDAITHVRIIDIVGDGSYTDTSGDVIYDPYPTQGGAGFDLDAIGVIHQQQDSDGDGTLDYLDECPQDPARTEGCIDPPDVPVLTTPANLANDISLAPTLTTQPFSDPNPESSHAKSRWQISTDAAFNSVVFDVTSATHLTAYDIPGLVLEDDTLYYWHVKFFDDQQAESDWSDTGHFTTAVDSADADANGIPDAQAVDNSVDLDNDGSPDNLQTNILSFKSSTAGVHIGTKASGNATIQAAQAVDPADIADSQGKPEQLPFGLVNFRIGVTNPGDTAKVTIYISGDAEGDFKWYKYDVQNGWKDFSNNADIDDLSDGRTAVTLKNLQDGGIGDADGIANGTIVDPGGLGAAASEDAPPGGEAGLGGGGCFLATAAYGSPMEPHVKTLRKFRDRFLTGDAVGRTFINIYYATSPPIAKFISKHDSLRILVRYSLLPIVGLSRLFLKLGYFNGYLALILLLCPVIGSFIYFRARLKAKGYPKHFNLH